MAELLSTVKSKAQQWLDSNVIDDTTKAEVRALISKQDPKELIDSFYKDLEFGTGGLRRSGAPFQRARPRRSRQFRPQRDHGDSAAAQ